MPTLRLPSLTAAFVLAAAALVAPVALAAPAAAAPVGCSVSTNGSFEQPDIQANPQPTDVSNGGFALYRTSIGTLNGWTVTAGTVDLLRYWANASEGFQSLDLWGTAPSTIQQTFTGLTPGASYDFSIDYSGLSTTQSTGVIALDLGSGFSNLATLAPVANGVAATFPYEQFVTWASYTHTFVATGSSATIRITNQVAPGPILTGLFVDNFSLGLTACDFGDAPDSYGTTLANGGPVHGVTFSSGTTVSDLMLGASVDAEEGDGQPSAGASGDDSSAPDDEDGVAAPIVATATEGTDVDVSVTNDTAAAATLAGWLDLDNSGTFDASELVSLSVPASSGTTTQTLSFPAGSLTSGTSYARFRLFPGAVDTPTPSGIAFAGEVEDYPISFAPAPLAALSLVKSASPSDAASYVLDAVITYTYVVTNTGTVPATDVTVEETAFTGTGTAPIPSCPAGDLAPGAQKICLATYTVTQEDVDATELTNTAIATGDSSLGEVESNDSSVTLPGDPAPAIGLVKSVSPTEVDAAGDEVLYSFEVTNTGNVTLNNGVAIAEDEFTGTGGTPAVTCPAEAVSLVPGETVVCTAPYTVTQADIDAGFVDNTATASSDAVSGGQVESAGSSATLDVIESPSASLEKTADVTSVTGAGQSIEYSFAVTNSGNQTLSGLEIDELAFTGSGTLSDVECDTDVIGVGETLVCTATYTTTAIDVEAGQVLNVAQASVNPPGVEPPTITSAPSTAAVEVRAVPPALPSTGAGNLTLLWLLAGLGLLGGLATVVIVRRRLAD